MSREDVYTEMQQMLGVVPGFFKSIPDNVIDAEWASFKQVQVEEHHIPPKYKELIGVALAGVTRCKYCAYYHTEFAKLFGASEDEIQEAMHVGKNIAGWSSYINGMQTDYTQFKQDVDHVCAHVRKAMSATG